MIIISVTGGLGNQMFQYAFYEQIKKIYPEQDVFLDIMHIFGHAHNGFEISNIFGLEAPDANKKDLVKLTGRYPKDKNFYQFHRICLKIKRTLGIIKPSFIKQYDFTAFEDKFFQLDLNESYYLYGAFANYKYFSNISDFIKSIYQFPDINETENLEWQKKIKDSKSVSIHIRRGDYIKYGVELASDFYYKNAMKYIEERIGKDCHYFVFTDDVDYVQKTYFDIDNLSIVTGNKKDKSYRDMQLMSMCKYNIIANSTFSFWGAFLNKNPDKIVIVPNMPYTGCKYPFTCDDWILL